MDDIRKDIKRHLKYNELYSGDIKKLFGDFEVIDYSSSYKSGFPTAFGDMRKRKIIYTIGRHRFRYKDLFGDDMLCGSLTINDKTCFEYDMSKSMVGDNMSPDMESIEEIVTEYGVSDYEELLYFINIANAFAFGHACMVGRSVDGDLSLCVLHLEDIIMIIR